jgi:hypothetical protein
MKKIIFLIFLCFSALSVISQSILLTGDTYFTCAPGEEISNYVDVKNISGSDITILCQKTILDSPPLLDSWAGASYCFAATCYSSSSTNPSLPATLIPGKELSYLDGDADAWSGHYNPNSITGESIVKYCFYDINNVSDQTCITITYNCSPLSGQMDFSQSLVDIGDFYPNPANKIVNFTFNGNLATLKLIDILGNNVKEILLNQEGVKKLDISDINKGIYFGNLIVNDEVVSIKKLIVK